jgi:hypothetical protein
MLLILGAYKDQAGNDAMEFTLLDSGARYPDDILFCLLQQRFLETGSVTVTTSVNAVRPWTVRNPARECGIITVV